MLYSIIVTVVLSIAVIGAFCVKAVKLDKCRRSKKSFVLIPWNESEKEIQRIVKSCFWEEVFPGRRCPREIILLIKDEGFVPEKAQKLEQTFSIVHCVKLSELESFLEKR